MIPLYDTIPTRRAPVVTLALIAVNILIFLRMAGFTAPEFEQAVYQFGAIPAEVVHPSPRHTAMGPHITLFSSMFLHAGFFHLAGNMLFLWIFGNNVEDIQGRFRFLTFYLLCGLSAVLAHIFFNAASVAPMVGASGAISGVLAAYLLAFPRARIYTLFWFIFFIRVIPVPAVFFIGFWFIMQVASIGSGGPVAWGAHVGGFVAGLVLALVFRRR
jgi:membrane associated rhomboid family serine protease